MTADKARQYELVLLGATGETGRWCAEHLVTQLPTDLRWAVAGRSQAKLEELVKKLHALNPDRAPAAIEVVASLTEPDGALAALARRARLLVSCVGPYTLHGEPVLAACAEAGTHYIDTTGEIPWVARMIRKYASVAQRSGAVLIPQCGFESAASDMLVREAVATLRSKAGKDAGDVYATVHRASAQVSGGTLASIFALIETFPPKELLACQRPFALSTTPRAAGAPAEPPRSLGRRLTGTFVHPSFGPQGIWLMGGANRAIVGRTWGFLTESSAGDSTRTATASGYGPRFTYSETLTSRWRIAALATNLLLAVGGLVAAIAPLRWIARRLVRQQGSLIDRETDAKSYAELRAEAAADDGSGVRCRSRLAFAGSLYEQTAVLMMQAAISLLRDGDSRALEIGGGVLTPATLGERYAERLRAVPRMQLEAEIV